MAWMREKAMLVFAVLLWPFRQLWAATQNLASTLRGVRLRDLLPPSILSTLMFVRDSLPRSMGFTSSRTSHLTGVVVFSIALVVFSFTLLTYVAIVWVLVFGGLGVLRLFPAVEARWPLTASSWPLWSVK